MMNQSPKLSTVESILLSSVLSSTQCTSHSWSGEKSCMYVLTNEILIKLEIPEQSNNKHYSDNDQEPSQYEAFSS